MHYLSASIPISETETSTRIELIQRYSQVIRKVLRQHKLGRVTGWGSIQNMAPPGRDVDFTIDWTMRELGTALELIEEALTNAGAPVGSRICEHPDPVNDRKSLLMTPSQELFRFESSQLQDPEK